MYIYIYKHCFIIFLFILQQGIRMSPYAGTILCSDASVPSPVTGTNLSVGIFVLDFVGDRRKKPCR